MIVALSTGFLAGNIIALWLCPELPAPWLSPVVLFVGLALMFCPCPTPQISTVRNFLLSLAFGFVCAAYAAGEQLNERLPASLEGVDVDALIRVASIPIERSSSIRFDAEVLSATTRLPGKVRLRWYTDRQPVQLGDTVAATLRLRQPRGLVNPGGFDYERYLFHKRIGAVGYIRRFQWLRRPDAYHGLSDRWRARIYQTLNAQAEKTDNAGPIMALAMGERGAMTQYHWRQLRMTGTSHLFAISGLHVSLVYGFAFFLAGWFWRLTFLPRRLWPAQKFAALVALPCAAAYAWLAGFSVPTQRALLMLGFVVAVFLAGRTLTLSQGIAAAMVIVLCLDPLQTLSVSFWLTFLACFMIAVCLYVRYPQPPWQQGLALQVWLPVALLPIIFLFFGQGAPLASLANLFAIPYLSFILLPCVLLASAVSAWPSLSGFLIAQIDRLFDLFWWLSECLTRFESLYWWHQPAFWAYPLSLAGAVGLIAASHWPLKIAALALMLPLSANVPVNQVASGEFRATFLDVGQALAVVLRTKNRALLYDTGFAYASGFDSGEQIVVPYLHKRMIRQLDALVVSHGDSDHAGGLASVLRHFQPQRRWSGASERFSSLGFSPCQRGIAWVWDEVRFEFLHPPAHTSLRGNEASCVLKVSNREHSLLLTGDIERAAEASLLQDPDALSSSLLLVPHHGSLSSSSHAFIEAVRPHFAIVSSGWRNRFGFPKDEVVRRYRELCAIVINTANTGVLSIHVNRQGRLPEIEWIGRRDQKRLWRLSGEPWIEREPRCRDA